MNIVDGDGAHSGDGAGDSLIMIPIREYSDRRSERVCCNGGLCFGSCDSNGDEDFLGFNVLIVVD